MRAEPWFADEKLAASVLVLSLLATAVIGAQRVADSAQQLAPPSLSGSPLRGLANISEVPAYLENFTLSATFESRMQFPDGGINENESSVYENTDNTLEAVWLWSRYYTLTRDNRYFSNVTRAWTYSIAHPAWLEGDSGKVYSCAWALKAEAEFRLAYANSSYLWYAERCAYWIVRWKAVEPNFIQGLNAWGVNDIRGLAAGSLYEWARDLHNTTALRNAVEFGNRTMQNITANRTWLASEGWALAGGVAYWGIVHSTFREYPNATWADLYGALLPVNVSNPGAGNGNSQCGWYAWYALGHYAAWEATGNVTHLNQFLNMTSWLIIQDGDRDGGIPMNFGDPNDNDQSWVTSYRALDLACVLRPWLGQPPDPPVLTSAILTGTSRLNLTMRWVPSIQDNFIGDVMRYDIYRNTTYDPDGNGYSLLGSVPAGTVMYTDSEIKPDWLPYFYMIRAADTEWLRSTASQQAAKIGGSPSGEFGHQLYGNPLMQADEGVGAVLADASFDYLRTYNASDSVSPWKSHMPGRAYQDFTRIPLGMALWANVSSVPGVRMAGLVPSKVVINLKAGWNLVAYCAMENETVGQALAGIPWLRVELAGGPSPYYLRAATAADVLQPGAALWILVGSDTSLIFAN